MPDATDEWIARLQAADVSFDPGLTGPEIAVAEGTYGFRFPPDLRALLERALPRFHRGVEPFPNWREVDSVHDAMSWPSDGVCFDVEHNVFWPDAWGERPASLTDALRLARAHVAHAPALVPVFGHRYLAAEPAQAGNPVLSVYQTDVIYYGRSLRDWIEIEFFGAPLPSSPPPVPRVRFWSDLIDPAPSPST